MLGRLRNQNYWRTFCAKPTIGAVISLWVVSLGFGARILFNYSSTPGIAADKQRTWPKATSLALQRTSHTLILAAHPKCPCTRASISELETIMTQSGQLVAAYVLLYRPARSLESWSNTDLKRRALSIAQVQVIDDINGRQASLFGARTSGQVLLYNRRGLLRFAGGITAARGHVGDNPGRIAVLALLRADVNGMMPATAVFGCSLQSVTEQKPEEIL